MDIYHILNDFLQLSICADGAEIQSVLDYADHREYLWYGDPKFWGRRSPVLFPFVGSLKDKSYSYQGTIYPMGQHGFARDMAFERLEHSEEAIRFRLQSNEKTYKRYPFHFVLRIGYQLSGRTVSVSWEVENQDQKTMYFSIGAHPAFLLPKTKEGQLETCYLKFDAKEPLLYSQLAPKTGLLEEQALPLPLEKGLLPVGEDLFAHDALIIEGDQAHKVSLLNSRKQPVVSVSFGAPLFGIWAPHKPDTPFVCIEPWYGRCDSQDFSGSLEERPYTNVLKPGEYFRAGYTMEFHSLSDTVPPIPDR